MRLTAVKGWDPLCEERLFKISRDFSSDLSEAVAHEHRCEDCSCDIRQALAAGYPRVAADLLSSAIDSLLLQDLRRAHQFNATLKQDEIGGFSSIEWQEWLGYWETAKKDGRLWNCPSCNAWSWDSTFCGACSADRP